MVQRSAYDQRHRHLRVSAQAPELAGEETMTSHPLTRRCFLAAGSLAAVGGAAALGRLARDRQSALIAVTFDLEMSRNFPTWEQTHWDYEKGNLNAQAKKDTVEAARRLKEAG